MAEPAEIPSMWEQEYLAVQKVLDSALGTEVEDGAGYGIAADVALVAERMKAAEAKLAQYENAITWNTDCTRCAATLDAAYAETVRAEKAEAKLGVIREQIAQHVEAWAENYPEDVFPLDGTSTDAIGARAMRHAYKNAARGIREDWGQDG